MDDITQKLFQCSLFVYLAYSCTGVLFGPYGPFLHHKASHHPHHPFMYKEDTIHHLPYQGQGFKTLHKHKINTTALCELKGGTCAPPVECYGHQQFFCEDYSQTCCYNRTKHVYYSKKLLKKDIINDTALCIAKGGICAGAGQCFGQQKFSCEDLATNCCFNSSHSILVVKKIIHNPRFKKNRRGRRKKKKKKQFYYPQFFRPKKRRIKDILYSHSFYH